MSTYGEVALVHSMSYLADAQAAIAHNLANVDTSNFKRRTSVAERSPDKFADLLQSKLPMVQYHEYTVFEPGVTRETGSRFNVAIDGPYFLRLQGADGRTYLTRDGEMQLDDKGRLVNHAGLRYLDQNGAEITLQGENGTPSDVAISPSGQISDPLTGQTWGPIGVVKVPDPAALEPTGGGLYLDTKKQPLQPAPGAPLKQGYLEGSNVDSLQELVRMIQVQRTFGATQHVLTSLGNMQRSVADNLLR